MSEEVIKLLQEQLTLQRLQMQELANRLASQGGTMTALTPLPSTMPTFPAFDPLSELWKDYWARFQTFSIANAVPRERLAHVFLTNQTAATYKLLVTLAAQQATPKDVNELSMEDITKYMESQYDPERFIVRERFKFWSEMKRVPGEKILELAARIRQDAAKCDFSSIKDPQDEAMRTRFICSVNNEAVLKALFKISDDELTFCKVFQIAVEIEDAALVAKETVYGSRRDPVLKVQSAEEKKRPKSPSPRRDGNANSLMVRAPGAEVRATSL